MSWSDWHSPEGALHHENIARFRNFLPFLAPFVVCCGKSWVRNQENLWQKQNSGRNSRLFEPESRNPLAEYAIGAPKKTSGRSLSRVRPFCAPLRLSCLIAASLPYRGSLIINQLALSSWLYAGRKFQPRERITSGTLEQVDSGLNDCLYLWKTTRKLRIESHSFVMRTITKFSPLANGRLIDSRAM